MMASLRQKVSPEGEFCGGLQAKMGVMIYRATVPLLTYPVTMVHKFPPVHRKTVQW
jgi:hypothetical protein